MAVGFRGFLPLTCFKLAWLRAKTKTYLWGCMRVKVKTSQAKLDGGLALSATPMRANPPPARSSPMLFKSSCMSTGNCFGPLIIFAGWETMARSRKDFVLWKAFFVLLLWGPEAKPILDPAFPVKESVDVGKYLDFTRWLECANGGKFEWGTGSEEKQSKSSKQHPPLLEFNPTNVNLCLFQQFTLFRRWWVKVERNHQCGFSARILMTATDRGNS